MAPPIDLSTPPGNDPYSLTAYFQDSAIDVSDMSMPHSVKPSQLGTTEYDGSELQYPAIHSKDVLMQLSYVEGKNSDSSCDNFDTTPPQPSLLHHHSGLPSRPRNIHRPATIRKEWLGTSEFLDEPNIDMQRAGGLDAVINFLKTTFMDLEMSPYDPLIYIQLGSAFSKLGFSDIGTAWAYRAQILIRVALGVENVESIPDLKSHVFKALGGRVAFSSEVILVHELKSLYEDTLVTLLDGLMGCGAFWDGMTIAKEARSCFPHSANVHELSETLKEWFAQKSNSLVAEGFKGNELRAMSRTGSIHQKPYPWMDKTLFYRTPALIRNINRNFGVGNCEVRPVIFGPDAALGPKQVNEGEDVGPCGIFALRDIQSGDYSMVDTTVFTVSDIPTSKLQHCEACHGALYAPYMLRSDEFLAPCCRKVAYCSQKCMETAASGYHKLVCNKDFDWLYKVPGLKGDGGLGSGWRPIMFLRFVSQILADSESADSTHPLQHPMTARLGANYSRLSIDQLQPFTPHDWQYQENVVAPTKILLQLGVNIFTDRKWDQDVIQTLNFRIDNNASMASIVTRPGEKPIDMINLSPQYIFFNHSCHPNTNWHSSPPNAHVDIRFAMDQDGNVHRPGESTVFCDATRDVKKGEQLFISYVGDPLGQGEGKMGARSGGQGEDFVEKAAREEKRAWLTKWFDDGCGCVTCERENMEAAAESGLDALATLSLGESPNGVSM